MTRIDHSPHIYCSRAHLGSLARYVRRVNDTRHSAKKQDWLILGECTVNNTNHSIFSTYSTPLSVNDAYSVPWYEAINPFASKYSTIVSSVSQSNPYFSPRS